jgi:hypothetical protein
MASPINARLRGKCANKMGEKTRWSDTREEELVRSGAVRDYVELARLGQVSRAHVTQIMNLLHLAPEIQEEILFLAPVLEGRDPIHLENPQGLAALLDWQSQRRRWKEMYGIRR